MNAGQSRRTHDDCPGRIINRNVSLIHDGKRSLAARLIGTRGQFSSSFGGQPRRRDFHILLSDAIQPPAQLLSGTSSKEQVDRLARSHKIEVVLVDCDDGLQFSRLGDTADKGPRELVRRLTHSQYNNTVRDLLGDFSQPASRFPEEDYVDGFKNQLTAQGMPPLLVETYSTSAEKLALNAFRGQYGISDVHLLMAASVVCMLPCIVLFFAMQKYFVESVAMTGLKS